MTHEEALQFLRNHQPMPDSPDEAVMDTFKATTALFFDSPNAACIPLYLCAFGKWEDLTIYESIQTVLRAFDKEAVVPYLQKSLSHENFNVRLWSADTAGYFPDERLIPQLEKLLSEESVEMRLVSAAALERIGTDKAREIASRALEAESDSGVLEALEAIVSGQ